MNRTMFLIMIFGCFLLSPKISAMTVGDWKLSANARWSSGGIVTGSTPTPSTADYLPVFSPKKDHLCILSWEYTILETGANAQTLELLDGAIRMELRQERAWLNHRHRGLFAHRPGRVYQGRIVFTQTNVISWKLNGYEQLPKPVAIQSPQNINTVLKLADANGGKTLWQKLSLTTIKDPNPLKTKLDCLSANQRQETSAFRVGINLPTDKIPVEATSYQGMISGELQLEAATNEIISAQLAVIADRSDLTAVTVQTSGLLSKEKHRLLPDAFSIYPVGYVHLDDVKITETTYGNFWPDVLLDNRPMTILKGFTQPYWLDITIPPKTTPGIYEGIITISSPGNGQRSLKIVIRVRDLELPLRNTLTTAFSLNPGSLERCYQPERSRKLFGKSDRAAVNAMYNMPSTGPLLPQSFWRPLYARLLSYRLNPSSIYSDGLTGKSDFRVVPAMEDVDFCYERGLNAICLACIRRLPPPGQERQDYFQRLRRHLLSWETFARKRNWRHVTWFIHGFDESEILSIRHPELKAQLDAEIQETANFLKKDFPWIKFETANGYIPRHTQSFDIFTPRPFALKDPKYKTYPHRDLWMYVACGPNKPYANFFIENPGSDPLALLHCLFFNRPHLNGFLYYRLFVEIYPEQWKKNSHPFPVVPLNVKVLQVNGDGILTYPGPDGRLLFSTRLANLRDAIQDYERLKLLRGKYLACKNKAQTEKQKALLFQTGKILTKDQAPARNWTDYSEMGEEYISYRKTINRLMEELNHAF